MNFLESAHITCEECCNVDDGVVVLDWEVSAELTQIHGYLHGGISAAIAEHAASLGAHASLQPGQRALGLSIDSHHLRPVPEGAHCQSIAILKSSSSTIQVWTVHQVICSQPALNTQEAPIGTNKIEENTQQAEPILFNTSTVTLYIQKAKQ